MTKMRWLLGALLGLALVGAGVGVGIASSAFDDGATTDQLAGERDGADDDGEGRDGDADQPLEGSDADRAEAAALAYTDDRYGAGGRVTEVEAGDDGAAFGVEVLLPDGSQVEVHLDADFTVTGDEVDDD